MKAFKFAGNSMLPRGVRSAVVVGAVVAGTLVGAGVANAAPAPNQGNNYQTCVTQGIARAVNASRFVPPLQRGTFLANQIARVTRDCRNQYPGSDLHPLGIADRDPRAGREQLDHRAV